jgi:hypothetical protein
MVAAGLIRYLNKEPRTPFTVVTLLYSTPYYCRCDESKVKSVSHKLKCQSEIGENATNFKTRLT